MAESPEHQFLSQCVSDTLNDLARTNLYAYVEAERRKFDFACELVRDWSRPLVGQTLWNHTAGLDKDIRTMLLDSEAEICAYVARDTMKGRRLFSEAIRDFRASGMPISPHRLRVFWVPPDFDADDESQRDFVRSLLGDRVSRDILMNVVFGNLTAEDVRFFVRTSGTPGLHFSLLHAISTSRDEYSRLKDLAESLDVSQGAIRERLIRLLGSGFLSQFGGGATLAQATSKGRLFLDLSSQLWIESRKGVLSDELLHILRLLEMVFDPKRNELATSTLHLAGPALTEDPSMVTARIIATIDAAVSRWGIDIENIEHISANPRAEFNPYLGEGRRQFVERISERKSGQ
ncbi:hypothetical protein [Actinoplanes sp. TFC3]|uniref:hypothetical protein n=1 Tax=Actinoplanes sp. TFC3 TaxID=1710355 RepID=UPI000AD7D2D9|nr:hypothetical protein [Actinoplanes sp. TFC3]